MIKVLFIIHKYFDDLNNEFGGTTREFYSLVNSFKGDKEIELTLCEDFDVKRFEEYRKEYDIIHCEDVGILKQMLLNGIHPDVIGPTAKSPAKNEDTWERWLGEGINPEDYFKSVIIRSNNSEERVKEKWKQIRYIKLGVNTEKILPSNKSPKRWVLWAGDVCRDAKNFQMFMDIMKITELPKGYNWKVMSSYRLGDYLEILDSTALLINTSSNETFCFAMFEANSKGVPSIYKKGLHNSKGHKDKREFHKDKRIQVEYTPEAYKEKILELLNDLSKLNKEKKLAREYVKSYASYRSLRESVGQIYKEIYDARN